MPEKALSDLYGEIVSFQGRPNKGDILLFQCPLCPSGHMIAVPWMPPAIHTSGCVWQKTGSTIEDITISPSINCDVPGKDPETGEAIPSDCKFHGWVKNGKVSW
jgi:hypothetical protein